MKERHKAQPCDGSGSLQKLFFYGELSFKKRRTTGGLSRLGYQDVNERADYYYSVL